MNEKEYALKLKKEYETKEEVEVLTLKKLDGKVKKPAYIFAYTFGIIGSLVLGIGMCLAMEVLGSLMPLGICIGIVGIAMVSINYPIYKKLLISRKTKYASEILALSEKLLNE